MNESGSGTATELVKVAVIGASGSGGHALTYLYPCLSRLPIDLMAVCDLDLGVAERVARDFGARTTYTDYKRMLSEADLDAVIICIGPEEHARMAPEVMEAGLHVYTEKPPAVDAEGTKPLVEASEKTGQICMTAFCKRFAPAYKAAKSAIDSPAFGAPQLLTAEWSLGPNRYAEFPDTPRFEFLLDFGIHALDTMRYLFGEVTEVYARKQDDDATFAISLTFANGGLGVLSMTDHRAGLAESAVVIGESGNTIEISHGGSMIYYRDTEVPLRYDRPFALADTLVENGYFGELAEFIDAVRERRQPESSIANAYQTMRLYDAVVRSANERRPVVLEGSAV